MMEIFEISVFISQHILNKTLSNMDRYVLKSLVILQFLNVIGSYALEIQRSFSQD